MLVDESESFAEFAAAEMARLYRLSFGLTHNSHDAWDLTQDCLVRVGLRWHRVDQMGNPRGFATTVLVRLHLNSVRSRGRELLRLERFARLHRLGAASEDQLSEGIEPWLEQALAELSGRQRAAVVLRYVADQSVDEIAEVLDCSPSTAKSHLRRGLTHLRLSAPVDAPNRSRKVD